MVASLLTSCKFAPQFGAGFVHEGILVAAAFEYARFDAAGSANLPDDVRKRLRCLAGRRMTADGVLVIEARRYRSQERNRADAMERLVALLHRAAAKPKARRKTKPTRASKERRLAEKRRRSDAKRRRRRVSPSDE